ncbi:Nurim [Frankliniella fusca]|uniref:Nurim n=1 Tax=Frankliniella fusca TaxID=407009 RepID=A0AAE1HCR2_9NEOP|nr:Nurim [Frankliniella fusca]KAK3918850.1 Nurim [Frankliniella fusca]
MTANASPRVIRQHEKCGYGMDANSIVEIWRVPCGMPTERLQVYLFYLFYLFSNRLALHLRVDADVGKLPSGKSV